MEFFSQNGQDRFIANLFKNKRQGIFVDVGAYDGVYYSNTFYFEKNLGWTGICIEPNPEVFNQLKKNRNCTCLNCCINSNEGTFKFLSVSGYGVMLSGLMNFFDKKHLCRIESTINDHGGSKSLIDVPAVPLKDLFSRHSITIIDYCNIDVEGGEMSVLNSIDFSKVKIKIFSIENNNRDRNICKFLSPYNYHLIAKLGCDEIYELNSRRFGLMIKWRIAEITNYAKLIWRKAKSIL